MLKKLHAGADVAEIKEQAKAFLGNIDPQKLALLEQEIIQEGVSRMVILAASVLHDIGIPVAKEKYGSAAGHYQEKEVPP